jgi:uncharacterized protein (TIRG00374 family)
MKLKDSYKKRDLKFWLNIVTIVLLVSLIFVSRHSIADAFGQLAELNSAALLLILPIQAVSYYAVARLYRDYFVSQGETISVKTMYKVALELNFVNVVFPSGGVSGFSYLSYRLKKEGISAGKATLANMLKYMLTFLAFLCVLFVGMLLLALRKKTNPMVILISSSVTFLTLFGVIAAVYIVSNEARIKAFVRWLPVAINKLFSLLRKKNHSDLININKLEAGLEEMHREYLIIKQNPFGLKQPFLWALTFNIAELATIYAVYIAFGSWINPGALIISYAVANIAGLIAILPGGGGVYEGLMTAVLVSTGINKGLALSATVVYRVLLMVIFLPVGFHYYRQTLKAKSVESHIKS